MVALACASPLDDGLVDDIEYLVKKKKADCTIVDVAENTPVNNYCDNNSLKQFFRMKMLGILLRTIKICLQEFCLL